MKRALLLVVLLVPAALAGLLMTTPGLGLLAGLATRLVPGLQIEGVSGPLPGRLAVARLRLADAQGPWLEAEGAALELDWRALWNREVHLTRVTVARVALARLPAGEPGPAEPSPGGSLLSLPVPVRIDAWALARLELAAPVLGQAVALALDGNAAIETGRLQARLAARRLDRPGEAALDVALDGATLRGTLDIAEPAQGLAGTLAGMPDAALAARLELSGPATGAAWQLRASLGAAEAALAGRVGLVDGALTLTAEGRLVPDALLPPDIRPLAREITPSLTLRRAADGALALERFSLTAPALRAEGSAALSATQALSGAIHVEAAQPEAFAPLLPAGLGWQALALDVTLAGTPASPDVTLRAAVTAPRVAAQADPLLGRNVVLDARYSGGTIDARLAAERLAATLRGPVANTLALDFSAELRDPPNLAGTLTAQGHLRGTPEAPEASFTLRSPRLAFQARAVEALDIAATATPQSATIRATGRFDAKPFNLAFSASRSETAVALQSLAADWSGISLSGQGGGALPAGPFTGGLRIEAPDLAPLGLGVAGRVTASLDASAIPGATGPAAQGVRLRLNGVGLGAGAIRTTSEAEVEGSLAALQFRLGVAAPQGGLDVAGRLAQGDDSRITLTRFDARAGEDALRLAAPATLRVAADGAITLDPARLLGRRGGTLAVQGRLAGGQLNGRAELAALPLAPLTAGAMTGTASGTVTAAGPTAAPLAEARIRLDALRLTDPAMAGLPTAQIIANARLQGQALRADARLTAGPGVQLSLEAAQPRGIGADAPIEASLRGALDLYPLSRPFLDAGGDRLTGRAQVDLRIAGTPAMPAISGAVTLADGSYLNPVLGARLNGIAARLTGSGQRLVVESFSARTQGGGTVSAAGWVEPLGAGIPAELRLRAEAARPVASEFGEATIDANILVRGPLADGGSVSGRVDIRRAELRIPENFAARVPSLAPVREVGPLPNGRRPAAAPRAAPARAALPLGLDITIAAPRAIFLRGRGLEAELGGEIRITGTAAAPVPQGQFRLRRGSFDLVGRQLQFSRGIIGFDTGSLTPTLDFLATARGRANTINLSIKGSPAAPELTVTAEPDLPQDEALARLLFDRETSRLSPFEYASIAQALAQLSGIGPSGGGVLGRLRSAAGLDRLGVSSEGGRAAVEAGRYIAPGVYVGVRQGTGGATPGVGVQVELTPRLRLEGQSSNGAAGERLGVTWEYEW